MVAILSRGRWVKMALARLRSGLTCWTVVCILVMIVVCKFGINCTIIPDTLHHDFIHFLVIDVRTRVHNLVKCVVTSHEVIKLSRLLFGLCPGARQHQATAWMEVPRRSPRLLSQTICPKCTLCKYFGCETCGPCERTMTNNYCYIIPGANAPNSTAAGQFQSIDECRQTIPNCSACWWFGEFVGRTNIIPLLWIGIRFYF